MFTRLIFRKPFQVARADIAALLSALPVINHKGHKGHKGNTQLYLPVLGVLCGECRGRSGLVPLIVRAEIEARASEMNRVLPDFVAEQAWSRAVFVARHNETACKIAQSRDDDQRHLILPFPPADAAH